MKKRVTLKDIANACGYSINTVSRALRNDHRLPAETIQKIQASASDLGYIHNLAAASLRSEKTHTIAVVVEDIQNPHYTEMLAQIALLLREKDYHIIIFSPQYENEYDSGMIQLAISHNIDGILLFPYMANNSIIRPVMQNHIPLVLVDREIQNIDADVVRFDDYHGGYLAGKKLTEYGHKKFLYLAGPLNNGSQPLRHSGFLFALQEAGVDLNQVRVIHSRQMLNAIKNQTIDEVLFPLDYTAIFSFNDQMAYYVMNCLQKHGYRIPEDISIVGFDHLRQTLPYLPPLSSISRSDGADLPGEVLNLLLSRIKNYNLPPRSRVLPVTFFDDGTVGEMNPHL